MELVDWLKEIKKSCTERFFFYHHNTQDIYIDLPCWGPLCRIVGGNGDGDYCYEEVETKYRGEFPLKAHDVFLFMRGSNNLSWYEMKKAYGGRFKHMYEAFIRIVEERQALAGGKNFWLDSTEAAFFIPHEFFDIFTKIEIMSLAMYVREMNRIREAACILTGAELYPFGSVLELLSLYSEAGIYMNQITTKGLTHIIEFSHLPWVNSISLIDQLSLLWDTNPFNYEFIDVDKAVEICQGDYAEDEKDDWGEPEGIFLCKGMTHENPEWSDYSGVVKRWMTPKNRQNTQSMVEEIEFLQPDIREIYTKPINNRDYYRVARTTAKLRLEYGTDLSEYLRGNIPAKLWEQRTPSHPDLLVCVE